MARTRRIFGQRLRSRLHFHLACCDSAPVSVARLEWCIGREHLFASCQHAFGPQIAVSASYYLIVVNLWEFCAGHDVIDMPRVQGLRFFASTRILALALSAVLPFWDTKHQIQSHPISSNFHFILRAASLGWEHTSRSIATDHTRNHRYSNQKKMAPLQGDGSMSLGNSYASSLRSGSIPNNFSLMHLSVFESFLLLQDGT